MTDLAMQILQFLQTNSNEKYEARQLASLFKVTTTAINRTCETLPLQCVVNARGRTWYFESEADKARIATRPLLHTMEKPKRDTRSMDIAMSRCRADRGGEFHPISIS